MVHYCIFLIWVLSAYFNHNFDQVTVPLLIIILLMLYCQQNLQKCSPQKFSPITHNQHFSWDTMRLSVDESHRWSVGHTYPRRYPRGVGRQTREPEGDAPRGLFLPGRKIHLIFVKSHDHIDVFLLNLC